MPMDVTNFLISLAMALCAAVSEDGTGVAVAMGTDAFVNGAREKQASDAYITLRVYGGNPPGELRPVPQRSIQFLASGKPSISERVVSYLANRFFEALYINEEGVMGAAGGGPPRNNWRIDAYKEVNGMIVADDDVAGWIVYLVTPLQPPSFLGQDAQNRIQVSFNCDVTFNQIDA